MDFITVQHPSQHSARVQRQIHAHAARVSHARARLSRVAAYNRQKKIENQDLDKGEEITEHPPPVTDPSTWDVTIPMTVSGAFEHEPLASFLRSLTSWEHSLFEYCEFHRQVMSLSKFTPLALREIRSSSRRQMYTSSFPDSNPTVIG